MLDPVSSAVVLNLLSSTLYSIIGQVGKNSGRTNERREKHAQALQPTLKVALDRISEQVDLQGVENQGPICLFLSSPEAEAIVRQIYSVKLLDVDAQQTIATIKNEFLASLSRVSVMSEEQLKGFSERLFNALVIGCQSVLDAAIDQGILPAHEAKANFRFHIIHDEIAALHKKIDLFSSQAQPDLKSILTFEETYRSQVKNRHWFIVPQNFDVTKKVPIDDIYVQSKFTRVLLQDEDSRNRILHSPNNVITVEGLLPDAYRLVILGNPGGGKSTFSTKLCHDLASLYEKRLFGGRQLTPVLVVLRDYGAKKKQNNYSLLDFIKAAANSDYQVSPPPQAFEYLLAAGRVVVVLDGLDELLDTRDRQIISDDVESFCSLYSSTPVIVTSREVGYEQAPLNENIFQVYRLAAFDESQVEEYAKKWFGLDKEITEPATQQKITSFLAESRTVPDLRSNPLMLSLLCNIYRGENYLPKNRPDVYDKCATMLFDRWDKSRSITVTLPFEASIKPAMMHLAHWIYSDEQMQSGVSENRLIEQAASYLGEKRFEDKDEANAAAREFIEFCRGRAWVFTDTGTTKDGERLFQFTHRTFLEYFTAFHLIRKYPSAGSLLKILRPKITKAEWDVVAQLAFQLLGKYQEGAVDQLLEGLLRRRQNASPATLKNLFSFAARSLTFLVPSPGVIRGVVSAVFNYTSGGSADLVVILLAASPENRPVVSSCLQQLIAERVEDGTDEDKIYALKVARQLPFTYSPVNMVDRDARSLYIRISEDLVAMFPGQIKELAVKDSELCFFAFAKGLVTVDDLVKWHGLGALFRTQRVIINRELFVNSALSLIFALAVQTEGLQDWELPIFQNFADNSEQLLADLGRILLQKPLPWSNPYRGEGLSGYTVSWQTMDDLSISEGRCDFSGHAMFGAFLILAIFMEEINNQQRPNPSSESIRQKIAGGKSLLIKLIMPLLNIRYTSLDKEAALSLMNDLNFAPEECSFALRWLMRETDFIQSDNDVSHNDVSQLGLFNT